MVQTWTLEWHDGNLVRATADPMARYCTGMSKIEYFYDSNPNPGKGFFSAEIISQDGFIDNPTLMCRNNLLHRVDYNPYHDEIHTYHNYWTYNYRPDGYPGQITTTYESLFWTTYTVKSFITYNMDNGKE